MERVVAVTVLVLAQAVPHLCRLVPAAADVDHLHLDSDSDQHASIERYGFLPTPNIATPVQRSDIIKSAISYFPKNIPASIPDASEDVEYWPPQSRHKHRKLKANDDGKLWTKFRNKQHLVEIVPIKHKSNGKRKALAYILPKSNMAKKKLKKQRRISGIVVNRKIPEGIVFDSSEENSSIDDDSYQRDSSESDLSNSFESSSSEDYESHKSKPAPAQANIETIENNPEESVNDEDSKSDETNHELNNIAPYLKEHSDGDLDNIIRDVVPVDENESEYQGHNVIHKKHHPEKSTHNFLNEDDSHHSEHSVAHAYYEPQKENIDDVQREHVLVNPVSDPHSVVSNHHGHQHNHKKIIDSRERSLHSPNEVYENDLKPHHDVNNKHNTAKHDELNSLHESGHELHGVEEIDTGYITENTNGFFHDLHSNHGEHQNPDLNPLNNVIGKDGYNPDDEAQVLPHVENSDHHHVHVSAESNAEDANIESDQSVSISESRPNSDSSGSISEESSKSVPDTNDSQPKTELNESSSLESNLKESISSESVEYIIAEDHSKSNEESVEIDGNTFSDTVQIQDREEVSPLVLHGHGLGDITSEESSSSEADNVLHHEMLRHDSPEISLEETAGHNFVLPDCLKLKKRKALKNCNENCNGHKYYKLTFLFNR